MKRMYCGIAAAMALCVMLSACSGTATTSDTPESSSVSSSDSTSAENGADAESPESTDSSEETSSDNTANEELYLKSKIESSRGDVLMALSYRYDENGRQVEVVEERPSLDSVTTTVTTYDEKGQVLLEERTSTMESYNYKAEYTRDEHGNPTQVIRTGSDGSQSVYVYENEYDDQGRLIKATEYDGEEVSEYTEYEYDDTHELPVKEVYTIGSILYSTTVRDFDSMAAEGLYVETISYPRTAAGEPGEEIFHYRVSDGLMVYSYRKLSSNVPDELTYEYDEYGNQTSVEGVQSAYDVHNTTEYTYDEAGRVLSSKCTSNNGTALESWTYEYAPLSELLYTE